MNNEKMVALDEKDLDKIAGGAPVAPEPKPVKEDLDDIFERYLNEIKGGAPVAPEPKPVKEEKEELDYFELHYVLGIL